MRFGRPGKYWALGFMTLLFGAAAIVGVRQIYHQRHHHHSTTPELSFYATEYPTHPAFQQELHQMRMQAKLSPENEQLILEGVSKTAEVMEMPPAVLWCLLFQESRLNHLAGQGEGAGAVGLGQFSHFSFYEVNHHLTKFSDSNLAAFYRNLGHDARPIAALKDSSRDDSYYHIPTAVVASAAYLNNRQLHLKKLLDSHRLYYNPDLLWLYATLGYNKGTRAVLSFWNTVHEYKGIDALQDSLNNVGALNALIQEKSLIRKAFERIWTKQQAREYADEWVIHFKNTSACALGPEVFKKKPTPSTGAVSREG